MILETLNLFMLSLTSFTVASLKAFWTRADTGRRAISTVEALRKAKCYEKKTFVTC